MAQGTVVRRAKPAFWVGLNNRVIQAVFDDEADARRSNQSYEQIEAISSLVDDHPFALGVVSRSSRELKMHGLFNSPAHASDFARAVGGEIRLVYLRGMMIDEEQADAANDYDVDPEIPT